MSKTYYYCKICSHISNQKSHSNIHIESREHIDRARTYKYELSNLDMKVLLDEPYNINFSMGNHSDCLMDIVKRHSQMKINNKDKFNKSNIKIKEIPIFLNHELTQFTKGKTKQALTKIAQNHIIYKGQCNSNLISIIVSNNSLLETQQWRYRAMDELDSDLKVQVLSSKTRRKDKDGNIIGYKNMDSFITELISAKSIEDIPSILIMCCHKKRILDDLIKLFDIFVGQSCFINYSDIKFFLNFDEPDANLGIAGKFISRINEYRSIMDGIMFITATPTDKFWKVLEKNNILKLLNINANKDLSEYNYEEYVNNYRQIRDHNYIECNYDTSNPLEYIKFIYEHGLIDTSMRKIVFAPAHICTEKENVGSHEEVRHFFNENDYCVFLSNGKFKGFCYPEGNRITLKDYKNKYRIDGELYKVLTHWYENNIMNLAITGYWTIERGVTFCTEGFNFTDIIVSLFHSNQLNRLVQLVGRATGDKKYCDKMNLICPRSIYDKVNYIVDKTIQLKRNNPIEYNKHDFSIINMSADKRSTIPIIVDISKEETLKIEGYTKNKLNSQRKEFVFNILKNNKLEYYNKYKNYKPYITRPSTDSSYKKHITSIKKASKNKKMFSIDVHDKNINSLYIFIDIKSDKLCCFAWNGDILNDLEPEYEV